MHCPRLFLVGTDTSVGKTVVATHLIRHARSLGARVFPFKPAQSGTRDAADDDDQRLLLAADLPATLRSSVCPLRYAPPVAPGVAADPAAWRSDVASDPSPLDLAANTLAHVEDTLHPQSIVIEGAGGLHVPMPGKTWQLDWIARLAPRVLVVARPSLGTINHTLLTIDALRQHHIPVVAFACCTTEPTLDPSASDNAAIIQSARGVPYLGTLPFCANPDTADTQWMHGTVFATLFAPG